MSALMSMRTGKTERKRGKAKNRKTERGGHIRTESIGRHCPPTENAL